MTKGRLEAFSDAVFAIAITLLVIEIHVPHVGPGESLLDALADQWPEYAAYAVSFAIIGIIWVNHHHVMTEVAWVDQKLTFINLGLLSAIAFLPFPTALLAEYVREAGSQSEVAAVVYSATMLVLATWFVLLWVYIARRGMYVPGIDAAGLRRRLRRALVAPSAYVVTVAVAFVSAPAVLILHAVIAVFYAFDTAAGEVRPGPAADPGAAG
jgi:uncharacterized membrane protein